MLISVMEDEWQVSGLFSFFYPLVERLECFGSVYLKGLRTDFLNLGLVELFHLE